MEALPDALGRAFDLANHSLVNLDNLAAAAHRSEAAVAHCFADPVCKEPSSLVGDAQGAVQLVCTHPLLRRSHEMERLKPDVELDVTRLHHALGRDSEVLPAFLGRAAIDARALGLIGVQSAAMRTNW